MHEREDERGIAHFIEHLTLARGSKHFKDYEAIKYLESVGAWFGADTNAMTSFESTRYLLDIPLDQPGVLDQALLICADVAGAANISGVGLEKERTVVLDELHRYESSQYAGYWDQIMEAGMPGSLYAKRSPIGLETVIRTISAEKLRAFYTRWYRPDRMAVVVVGDVDASVVERKIQSLFGSLICPEEPALEPVLDVQTSGNVRAVVYTKPAIEHAVIDLIAFSQDKTKHSFEEGLNEAICSCALNEMLEARLEKKSAEDAKLIGTFVKSDTLSGRTDYVRVGAGLFDGLEQEGIVAFHEELERVRKDGFSRAEWELFCQIQEERTYECLANLDRIEHQEFASGYMEHFLIGEGEIIPPKRWLFETWLEALRAYTLTAVNDSIATSLFMNPSVVMFRSPKETLFDEPKLLEFFKETRDASAPIEKMGLLFNGAPTLAPGKIVQERESAGFTEWTLSNGIRVWLKRTDLVHGYVDLLGWAKGGFASFDEGVLASAMAGCSYASISERPYELKQMMVAKGLYAGLSMNPASRSVYAGGSSKEIELQLQLLHAQFTAMHFHSETWKRLVQLCQHDEAVRNNDPERVFGQFVADTNSQSHPFMQPLDVKALDEELARSTFATSFGSPQEFSFAIVGDFEPLELRRLVETYIASLPMVQKEPLGSVQIPPMFPTKTIEKDLHLGDATVATVIMTIPYEPAKLWAKFRSFIEGGAIGKILEQRLMDVLRIQLGQTYGVSVHTNAPFLPDLTNGASQVIWTAEPKDYKQMIGLVRRELARLQREPPSIEEVRTARALISQQHRDDVLTNSYWINAVCQADLLGISLEEKFDFEAHLQALTPESLHIAAQILLESPHSSVLTHLPE